MEIEEIKNPSQLGKEILTNLATSLKVSDLSDWQGRSIIYRTLRHTVAWFANYFRTETEELEADFVTDVRGYSCFLVKDVEGRFFGIRFRLSTLGKQGYTEYGIEVRRGVEGFACLE